MDADTVKKIAKLARLNLAQGEAERYAGELSSIFKWIEQLGEVKTDQVPEMSGAGDVSSRLRADAITDGGIRDDVLANAPQAAFGCYVVPKVVE